MSIEPRPLIGSVVGLSIADGEDSAALGFPPSEVNRTALRIVMALLGQGAGVSFGHDWRDDGVMEAVHAHVERFRPFTAEGHGKPLLWNFVPWPDKPRLTEAEQGRLKETLRIEEAGLPETLRRHASETNPSRVGYLRARGLTHLRHKLTEKSNARVCLGGRIKTYAGRYPGIVEEALLAIRNRQPVYIASVLGGAAQQVILALEKENEPESLCCNDKPFTLFSNPPIREEPSNYPDDLNCSPREVWEELAAYGVRGLSDGNGLSLQENERLFESQAIDEIIELILTGLGRIAAR